MHKKQRIILKPGRERAALRRHPWIFSNAIRSTKGDLEIGQTIEVMSHDGRFLGYASYSPHSQIRARFWNFDKNEPIDRAFFSKKIASANAHRAYTIAEQQLTGYRVVANESDGLPGITIDKYDNVLVCQLLSAGAQFHKSTIVDVLIEQFPDCAIYERSDVASLKKEGLEPTTGLLHGTLPPMPVTIMENDIAIGVDVITGHKTGFYLDQRDNRHIAAQYCKDKTVLNCFSYTGTFALYGAKAGAKQIENVEISAAAIERSKENMALNQLSEPQIIHTEGDVFKVLRHYQETGKKFDVVIMDPPKFAENKSQLEGAARGYKDINRLAFELLTDGGLLFTYSCSGLMSDELFQKIIADAALDANCDAQIFKQLTQAQDHPINLNFPEGFYLNGLAIRVTKPTH